MNNNSSKQVLLSVIGVAILVVAVVGVSFAFFSYVYNGENANTVKTGTIVFTASDSQLTLTNVFPTSTAYSGQGKVASVSIQGNTTYETGIDFTVRALDVTNADTTNKIVPTVTVTPVTVANVTFAEGYKEAKAYDATTLLKSGDVICKGTIAAGAGVTDATEILSISAYYPDTKYHISDNGKQDLVDAGLLQESFPETGIISTADWNALSGTADSPKTAYSFKIQVTAVENGSADPRVTQ